MTPSMDILFVQSIWFEFLGTMSLLATAKASGHSADVAIGSDTDILREIARRKPGIVAFSTVTGIQNWALQISRRIKTEIDPGIRTLMGGPHPTFFPEILDRSPHLDFLCVGEGEGAVTELLNAGGDPARAADIPNIHLRVDGTVIRNPVRPLESDLDRLPFMDRESYYKYPMLRDNPVKRLISGRGCPHSCAFCFNHSAMKLYRGKGPYVRKRSVENVLAEIRGLVETYPVTTFRFEDDLFGVNTDWLMSFCERYASLYSIPYICSMRADGIDESVIKTLKETGCYNVVIGVETGDETLRNTVLKKNITDEQLRRAASLFHKYDLNFCTTNILGLPGETFEQSVRTVTFTQELRPRFTWCSVFQPYPRTRLGEQVMEERLVDDLNVNMIEPNYHSQSLLNQPDIRRSVNLHKFFYIVFNHPWTLPLVKWLTKLPPNPVFLLIHRVSFLMIYARRWNISLFRAAREALKTTGFTRKVKDGDA